MIYLTGYKRKKDIEDLVPYAAFKQFYSMRFYEFPTHGRQPK